MKENNLWIIGILIVVAIVLNNSGKLQFYSVLEPEITTENSDVILQAGKYYYRAPEKFKGGAINDFRWIQNCYEAIDKKLDINPLGSKVSMDVKVSNTFGFSTSDEGTMFLSRPESGLQTYYEDMDNSSNICTDNYGDGRTTAHELVHVFVASRIPLWANEGLANYISWSFIDYKKLTCTDKEILITYSSGHKIPGLGFETDSYPYKPVTQDVYNTGACFWNDIEDKFGFDAINKILVASTKMEYDKFSLDLREREWLTEIVIPNTNNEFKEILISKYGLTEDRFIPVEKKKQPIPVETKTTKTIAKKEVISDSGWIKWIWIIGGGLIGLYFIVSFLGGKK